MQFQWHIVLAGRDIGDIDPERVVARNFKRRITEIQVRVEGKIPRSSTALLNSARLRRCAWLNSVGDQGHCSLV